MFAVGVACCAAPAVCLFFFSDDEVLGHESDSYITQQQQQQQQEQQQQEKLQQSRSRPSATGHTKLARNSVGTGAFEARPSVDNRGGVQTEWPEAELAVKDEGLGGEERYTGATSLGGRLTQRHIPHIIIISDIITGFASGMTIKFFPLFFKVVLVCMYTCSCPCII